VGPGAVFGKFSMSQKLIAGIIIVFWIKKYFDIIS
jgi:hypothetical protein